MKEKTAPAIRLRSFTIILFGMLLLLFSGFGTAAARDDLIDPLFLVRIEQASTSDLAISGMSVFEELFDTEGNPYLLATIGPEQQEALIRQGYKLKVLDENAQGADYYLLYGPPEALEQARALAQLLEVKGQQAIARVEPAQAAHLSTLKLRLLKLAPRTITRPSTKRAASIPSNISFDPLVQEIINQVDSNTVYTYNGNLSGEWPVTVSGSPYTLATRYTYSDIPIKKATRFAYEHFTALGLMTGFHSFNISGYQKRNVVAVQPGLKEPERSFLITAHLDSTSGNPYVSAPGADDNASGSVGVLIAADILSQYNFGCTIRYVLFTGEEQGLYGSKAYAQAAAASGDNIEAVLNLDMIGYNSDSYTILDLHARSNVAGSVEIANLFSEVVNVYNLPLTTQTFINTYLGNFSDNKSFWDAGYAAILAIEDDDDFTPHYHTTNDKLSSLDINYFTSFIKAALGTMGHMGCLMEPQLSGAVTDVSNGNPISGATVTAYLDESQAWEANSLGDGSYTMGLPAGTYSVTVTAPSFLPGSAYNVEVIQNETTALDFPLQACLAVNGPNFTFEPTEPEPNDSITFNGTVMSGTEPFSFDWAFGDGTTASGQIVTHSYPISDVQSVVMTTTNCAGPVIITRKVFVGEAPNVEHSPALINISLRPGEEVTHTLSLSNTGNAPLDWSLVEIPEVPWLSEVPAGGILDPANKVELFVSFSAPMEQDAFTSTLQIISDDPSQPRVDIPVRMSNICQLANGLDFSVSPPSPRIGQIIQFTGSASGGTQPIAFTWDFGDGTIDTGEAVTHTFQTSAVFTVTMEASTCAGITSVTKQVSVSSKSVLAYTPGALTDLLRPGETVQHTLTLSNMGDVPLTWDLAAIPPTNWLTIPQTSGAVDPVDEASVPVSLTAPPLLDVYTTTLQLTSNDPSQPIVSIPVTMNVYSSNMLYMPLISKAEQ